MTLSVAVVIIMGPVRFGYAISWSIYSTEKIMGPDDQFMLGKGRVLGLLRST